MLPNNKCAHFSKIFWRQEITSNVLPHLFVHYSVSTRRFPTLQVTLFFHYKNIKLFPSRLDKFIWSKHKSGSAQPWVPRPSLCKQQTGSSVPEVSDNILHTAANHWQLNSTTLRAAHYATLKSYNYYFVMKWNEQVFIALNKWWG